MKIIKQIEITDDEECILREDLLNLRPRVAFSPDAEQQRRKKLLEKLLASVVIE